MKDESSQARLLGADKANGAEAHSSGKINLKSCKQHSSGELKFSSSQPMLIPHWRRKQRYHTALPSQPMLSHLPPLWGGLSHR